MHLAWLATSPAGRGSPWIPQDLYERTQADTQEYARELARPGMRVLDVGVGPGLTLEALTEIAECDKYGIDVAPEYIIRLTKKHPAWNLLTANAEKIPCESGRFDLVLCTDVLEHVLDVHQAMREVVRVLKIGGAALIRVPCEEDMEPYLMNDCGFEFVHVRSFCLATLRMLIEKCHGQLCEMFNYGAA